MVSNLLKYDAVLACGVLLLACLPASADDKKSEKPVLSGTWGKKDGELKIEFADQGVLKIAPHGDSAMLAIVCKYTVAKDGQVKVKVTGYEGDEDTKKKIAEHVSVGQAFRFTWTVQGDTAKLDNVTGENVEAFKSHLEGNFEKK
jgi:hypothetical protein